jgi:hypothetical protein
VRGLIALFSIAIFAGSAFGQSFQVEDNGLLRLPKMAQDSHLENLSIGRSGKLLVPSSITQLVVDDLVMAENARISIAPRETQFVLTLKHASLADGSVLAAVGSHGDFGVPGGDGTHVKVVIETGEVTNLVIDASGGKGGDGWAGATGSHGKNAVCWGLGSSAGSNGGNGSNGMPGGDGGNVELSLAQSQWLEVIDIRQQGGIGGQAGAAGAAGKGGRSASCWLYSLGDAAQDGQQGQQGQAAAAGSPGILTVHQ